MGPGRGAPTSVPGGSTLEASAAPKTRSVTFRTALERRPSLRDLAKEDTDLDSLRDEPAFRDLVG